MKFAKQLSLRSIPSWAPYYIDYKSLKHYIKTSFKDLGAPLESLESLDHVEDEDPVDLVADPAASEPLTNIDSTADLPPLPPSKQDSGVVVSNGEELDGQRGLQIALKGSVLSAGEVPKDIDQEVLADSFGKSVRVSSKKTQELSPVQHRAAIIDRVVDGFKALLWAELEKVNARYEAQEKVATNTLERLNTSWRANFTPGELKQWRSELTVLILNLEYLLEFSQTNITGFKKIIKKFDKHYRSCNPTGTVSSPASSVHGASGQASLAHSRNQTNNGNGNNSFTQEALAILSSSVETDSSGPFSNVFGALGIHGRSTPTIYLPRNYPEPATNLHPEEPFLRTMTSPNTQAKSIFYSNYYGDMSTICLDFWRMVTERTFAKSEKDERLLTEARTLWRKRTPVVPEHVSPKAMNLDTKEYPVLDDLDLGSLPSGRLTRLWVVLAEDAMSSPIRVPVIVAKGVRPGPVVGLTAALHGNELNGIPLTHRLVLQEIQCQALHGIVVAVPVTNVPGYLAGQRGYSDGTDLNRVMPGKKDGSTSQVYAYNLMNRIIRHFTHLIDLHTASKGRVNSLYVRANMQNPITRHMARLQNPQIIVHNTSPDGSLRGAAMQECRIPAITVEIGDPSRFQKRFVKSAILGVTNILSHLKMIEDDHQGPDYDPVVCAKSYWIFTKGGGILNVLPDVNTWVRKGELIATLHNIFGKEEHRYFAPEDGIVVGKSVDPVCQSGCRILHLGVVSDRFPEGKINDGHQ